MNNPSARPPAHLLARVLCASLVAFGAQAAWASADERREDARESAKATLERLHEVVPSSRRVLERASGYAVFTNMSTKIFVAGGGMGSGIAVDNRSKKVTYMRMVEVAAGLGFGVKKYRLVWVFERRGDLQNFIDQGFEVGASAAAAAAVSGQGVAIDGAVSVKPGVFLYQLTDEGVALELTARGTKYFKDPDLN